MLQDNQADADGLAILEERVASDPQSISDVHALADAYADRGQWDDAIKAYRAAIALDAANADLHNSLGTVYEEVGDLEEAERAYQQAIVLKPNDSMAYYNLGLLYEEQQRVPEAIQALEKCLRYSRDADERSEVRKKLASMLPERKDVVQMYKSIRSWATTSLVLGGLSVFAGGTLDPVWGVVMIIVAILSWRIKIPAMFVLYSVFVAWAAIMNGLSVLVGGGVQWLLLAAMQVYWVISILKQFTRYNQLPLQELYQAGTWPVDLAPPQQESIITGRFSIAGVILAVIALILLPTVFVGGVVLAMITSASQPPQLMEWLLGGAVDIAVLALGLSCAAVLSKNNRRGWAIGGIAVSALVLIGWLVFPLVPNLLALPLDALARFERQEASLCSDPLELDNYDSSSRISPRKGKHYVKASSIYTKVQSPGSPGRADRCQRPGRNLPEASAEVTGFLPLAKGIPGTGSRDLCHRAQ